jgi:hypothetical protein
MSGDAKCRICGCSWLRPCDPPCSWTHKRGEEPLCSVCNSFTWELARFIESTGASAAGLARLRKEAVNLMLTSGVELTSGLERIKHANYPHCQCLKCRRKRRYDQLRARPKRGAA